VTLIAQYNSGGCVGRCDASCYEATKPVCKCICGGRNHGVGVTRAVENTHQIAQVIIDRHNAEHPGAEWKIEFPPLQESFFQ
jgi:hypothetical protein